MTSLSPLSALHAEYVALKPFVEAHREKVAAASEAVTDAMEFAGIPTRFGVYQIDLARDGWRYPSIAEAARVRDELRDDDGFYWAESRLRDLEMVLGLGWKAQTLLPFERTIPDAHPSVKKFVSGRV